MEYKNYKYIYPPRPENKISPESLQKFESGFLVQPKLNGSSMQIYTDGKTVITMNRHKEPIMCKIDRDELKELHRGDGWMVLCGEYMNKNQKDENNEPWNIKFVIFDILVLNGAYLLKTTFKERFDILTNLYKDNPVKKHLHYISENCFRVGSIESNFDSVYKDITRYQMYEGLVLKQTNGKLEIGTHKNNNLKTQIKCRKPTKNYAF